MKTILQASRELGVDIEAVCGEKKKCGKCKVRIEEGFFERYGIESKMEHLTPLGLTEEEMKFIKTEEEAEGYRLGCVTAINGDILVFVPEESRAGKQVVRKAATERAIKLDPTIRKFYVELPPPSLHEPMGDWERLTQELKKIYGFDGLDIDYFVLKDMPIRIRQGNWNVTVTIWNGKEVVKIEPGFVEKGYGLAIDIGTTTVAAYLCDVTTGSIVAVDSMMNPQVPYGEDVMSRITYAMMHEDGLEKLHRSIIDGLNKLIQSVSTIGGITPEDICELTIVGNTAMHHLLMNIYPEHIGVAPFPPTLHHSLDVKARDLKLNIYEGAYVHVLPIEAGFVGADNVGVLIAEEPYNQDSMELVIDIGTNGELVLGNSQKLISSSCATGPALEGAHVYITLTARGLNPRLYILARAGEEGAEVKLMRAGASKVISPYTIGATRMAHAILRPSVVDFIELATATENLALQIEEIEVAERCSTLVGKTLVTAEIRQSMGIIIVAIKQPNGHMLFNPPSHTAINAHSVLIILGKRPAITQLEQLARG